MFCTLLLIAGVLIFYQVWRGNSQLEQLEAALQRYAQGNYSQPIPVEQYTSSNLELIAALSAQIGSQSGRAEESSRQFVSNVSHELRTPMTIISGFVEGILDGTVPKNKRMEYLSIVSQEVQRLKMLVTSMLNLTKFDAGTIQLNYRMFILNDTAFRTILMFENRLEKRHISVEGLDGEPVRVCADPDLIGQVVYNLVENAVKFVNDGGTISFTFAVGSALAGIGAVLYAMAYTQASPTMGMMLGTKAFVAAVLGGIGSIPGAVVGGLLVGFAEVIVTALGLSVWKDAVVFLLLIIVLVVRPTGIFGRTMNEKV